jgi:histidinol-phosphate phosphatase family protein
MKILADGRSLAAHPGRLAATLPGLHARGHDVRWLRGTPPAGLPAVADLRELHDWRPDVLAGAGAIESLAWLGWRAHAGAMLIERAAADFARDGLAAAIGWASLPAFALVPESETDAIRAHARHVPLERIVLWSGAEPAAGADVVHPDVELLERAGERLTAMRIGRAARPAVFVDRDGTLVVEEGYLSEPARMQLLPGVARALRQLREAGLPIVVISNQAGVGRGLYPIERAYATMARLRRMLRAEGVELDAVRFCPHAPDAGCECRKPGTLLMRQAAEDLRLSLAGSAMVGDKRIDVEAGQAMGGMGLLVRTGYGREEEPKPGRAPDGVFDDLTAAAAWILERYEAW